MRFLADLRYALRSLLKTPGFTSAALLTLGLGLGLNAAIFSAVYGVLLRPLDLPNGERLCTVWQDMEARGGDREAWTGRGLFTDWRSRSQSFESMTAFIVFPADLTGVDRPETVTAAVTSQEYFSVLGVEPIAGRGFLPEEEQIGKHLVAVLTHGLWQRRFGGDLEILNQTITVNQIEYRVVGILPEGFRAPLKPSIELFSPLPLHPPPEDRGHSYVRVLGLLEPGVSMAAAQQEMDSIAKALEAEYPKALEDVGVTLRPLLDSIVGSTRELLLILLGAVLLVLLAASVNVANLMLSRAASRRQDMGIRLALGAGRGRLAWQIFGECLLLALGGSVLGLLVGRACLSLFRTGAPAQIPRLDSIQLDGAVFAYTLAVALAAGLLAGLLPAIAIWKNSPSRSMNLSASTGRRSGHHVRGVLVAAQIALGVVLLIGSGLLLRTLANLSRVDLGFQTENLVLGRLTLSPQAFPESHDIAGYLAQVEEQLSQRPEVAAAGVASALPIADGRSSEAFVLEGSSAEAKQRTEADLRALSPGFLESVELPILSGRPFIPGDSAGSTQVAIVNQRFVERFLNGREPVGERVRLGAEESPEEPWRTIVGVAGDLRGQGIDQPAAAEIYVPISQRPPRIVTLVAQAARSPAEALEALLDVPGQVRADQVVASPRSMTEILDRELAVRRFTTRLLGIFATVVLTLIAVGVFGIVHLSITQRRREIAIRLALGARIQSVVRMVLTWSGILIAGGLVAGFALAFFGGRALTSLLYGVDLMDSVTTAGVVLVLAVVGGGAALLSVLGATKIEPAEALKETRRQA